MVTSESIFMIVLFGARILIPLLITFGIAYLYDRLEARSQERSATAGDFPLHVSSSKQQMKSCPIPVRAEAACSRWPNLPCWLALQLTEGQVPKECHACMQFEEADLSHRFPD
jgi:hypothetical protein